MGVCLFLVVAFLSFCLVSSPYSSSIMILTHRSPEYILELLMPSNNNNNNNTRSNYNKSNISNRNTSVPQASPPSPPLSPLLPPSPSSLKDFHESNGLPKGFLVYSPSCSIPDLDPFHHSIKRFINKPKAIICRGPPAFTSSRGSTLHLHTDILHRSLPLIQQIYRDRMYSTTSTKPPPTSKATNITTTTTTVIPNISTRPPGTVRSSSSSLSSLAVASSPSFSSSSKGKEASVEDVKCCYKGMYRVEQKREKADGSADGRWRYSSWCHAFNTSETEVQENAALIVCRLGTIVVYKNVHYFFRRKNVEDASSDVERVSSAPSSISRSPKPGSEESQSSTTSPTAPQATQVSTSTKGEDRLREAEKLSVIVIGTDSASRLNMMRQMPKTYNYLTMKLGALNLQGYNKVGDNTFPNVLAIMGGYTVDEVDKDSCMTKSRHFDDCHWTWKEFKKNGYVTAYVEDSPWMGCFHYLRRGFISQPTDYYGRSFFLASEKEIGGPGKGSRGHECQGPVLSLKVVQDYSLEFARTFLNDRTFGFYWSASLSHDLINMLHHADEPHLQYLQELDMMGALNHTAIFFLSDHGMRWGGLRSTYIGMLEERLPYVFIYLPPWFRKKYHQAYSNVVTNTHRLTANFDLHETLLDLANGRFADLDYVTSAPSTTKRGISLFRNVPWNRTCAEAGVSQHFCACQDTQETAKDDPHLGLAVNYLKEFLNEQLRPHPQCEQFSRAQVVSSRVSRTSKEMNPKQQKSEVKTYLLQATLFPGTVAVEVSLRFSQQMKSFQVLGNVSRINKYGSTSGCIRDDLLRKYCYCKDQKKAKILFAESEKELEGRKMEKR